MASAKKPAPKGADGKLSVARDGSGRIYSHLRKIWLVETPEERVRQEYLCALVNEYGFALDQMAEEVTVTNSGSGKARADFLIWRSTADKTAQKKPLIVIECKADNVQINAKAYGQGANYAQYCQASLFVTHNNRETKYWRVDHARMMPNFDEVENIPHADATDTQIEDLLAKLKVFKEEEFADLLQKCHNVIRNRESHDPTKAFDETSKILFVKVWVERELKAKKKQKNIFSAEFLEEQVGDDPINDLFAKTKQFYEKDALFGAGEKINLRPETSAEIVKLLERYNLSDTSEDIKGIAFERFLGRTFRGEIGQFFTPRPIVEFMIRMLSPQENEVICDPASGSGGFLIRFFEIVRQQILFSADQEYREFEETLNKDPKLSDEERGKRLLEKYTQIQKQIDPSASGSRLWTLANRCIYGSDKNDRMARTSKMNMIMHGDGHGGIHHSDGFINVNGIYEGRFDLVLTNPPFGSKVSADDKIRRADIELTATQEEHYEQLYGDKYREARTRLKAAANQSVLSLFELSKGEESIKTELLFIERCIDLLRPGGRMGIVLPEGVFNNPSVTHVRQFVEDRARLYAVVSLPADTFVASGATVKTSLLFLRKFTDTEAAAYEVHKQEARGEAKATRAAEAAALQQILDAPRAKQTDFIAQGMTKDEAAAAALTANDTLKKAKANARAAIKQLNEEVERDGRKRLRVRVSYPIFMYDAEKVGITATGGEDDNELYPNPRFPASLTRSALEEFHRFLSDPEYFIATQLAEVQ